MRTKNFIKTVKSLMTEADYQKEFDNYVKWESKKIEQGNRNIELLAQAVNQSVSKVNKAIDDFTCSVVDCSEIINSFTLFVNNLLPIPEDCQVPPMNLPCNYGRVWGIDWDRTVMGSFDVESLESNKKMLNCPYFANSPHLKCTANPTNTNCLECNEH
jgi:hypothetical protein